MDFYLTLVLMLVVIRGQGEAGSTALTLDLVTDPPGPAFPAATWLRLACRENTDQVTLSETLSYQWRGWCSRSGEILIVIDDASMDREGYAVVWAQSTPIECLDVWECVATDGEGNQTSIDLRIIGITGVGISINVPLESIENNSAIILSNGAQDAPLDIYCHSTLENSRAGGWFLPNGDKISTDRQKGELSFYWVLSVGQESEEGMYLCMVPGALEEDEAHVHSIGIYQNDYELANFDMVDMTYRESEMDSLTLGFTTIALPATAFLWSSNGILLSLNGSDNYYTYTAGLTLSEPASALYTVTLQIHDQSRNNIEGNFLCEVYSSWMSADQSTDGRERVTGQFVFLSLGEMASLKCVLPEESTNIKWYEGNELIADANETKLELMITDTLHLALYICQGRHSMGMYNFYTKIIVQVPDEVLSVNVTSTTEPFTLTCCASKLVGGISNKPLVSWHDPDGTVIDTSGALQDPTSEEREQTCLTLIADDADDTGMDYMCMAVLNSPAFTSPLVKTVTISTLDTSGLSSTVVIAASMASGAAALVLAIVTVLALMIAVWAHRHRLSAIKIDKTKQ